MFSANRDASVAIRVVTAKDLDLQVEKANQRFQVLYRTDGGTNTAESKAKSGEKLEWDDYFYYNLREVQHDDLIITLLMNNSTEVGSAVLTYKKIKKNYSFGKQTTTINLQINGRKTGQLVVEIQRLAGEEVVGGIEPPVITLRPGAPLDSSVDEPVQRGIQKIRTAKLNFFSFCDAKDLDREFMPQKFQSKGLQNYLMQIQANAYQSRVQE